MPIIFEEEWYGEVDQESPPSLGKWLQCLDSIVMEVETLTGSSEDEMEDSLVEILEEAREAQEKLHDLTEEMPGLLERLQRSLKKMRK